MAERVQASSSAYFALDLGLRRDVGLEVGQRHEPVVFSRL
jgi:hypothetical protein